MKKANILFVSVILFSKCSFVFADAKINTKYQSYSVGLGATRVIYDYPSDGASISVNNPNDYPVLVQSSVTSEDKVTPAPFIVTPPLFRLDDKQQSRVRIIMTEQPKITDRETLNWLCITGIPPEKNDAWLNDESKRKPNNAELQVKFRISRCIKLILRPAELKGRPNINISSIAWTRSGEKIRATNSSPYIISPGMIKIGNHEIENPDYVPAFGYREYSLPKGEKTEIQWSLITDEGIASGPYKINI